MKKTNPRNRPATQADVKRAWGEGFEAGVALHLDVMIFTLGTDFSLPDVWLEKFHERYMAHMDSYAKGYLTQEDMRKTTLAEKNWQVEIK